MRERIIQAFRNAPYPGDDHLIRNPGAAQMDDYAQIIKHCTGKSWMECDHEAIINNDVNLPFFSPEALAYYLPAFMLVALDDPGGSATEEIEFALTPPRATDRERTTHFQRMAAHFSAEQRAVIRDFLERAAREEEKYVDESDARKALQAYWDH
jgi:hypothetical protein